MLFSTTEWLSELKTYELKTSEVLSVLVWSTSNLCLQHLDIPSETTNGPKKGFKNTPSPPGIGPQALNFWSSATLGVHPEETL